MIENFLTNVLRWTLYAGIFCILLGIAIPTLSAREYVGYSLILGFFAGLINNIEVVLKDLYKNNYKDNN